MKKLFVSPVVEVKALSPDTEVMGVFSVASSAGQSASAVTVIKDTTSKADDNAFSYWNAK